MLGNGETSTDKLQQNNGNGVRKYRFGPSMHPLRQCALWNELRNSDFSGQRSGLELGSVKMEPT